MAGVPQVSHVAVKNIAGAEAIQVYPNPASGTLHINSAQGSRITLSLLSVSGQTVLTQTIDKSGAADVSLLPSGLYLYQLADEAGAVIQNGKITIIQ
jgi:hypothetical protein